MKERKSTTSSFGGIGELSWLSSGKSDCCLTGDYSQIFPSYSSARRPLSKDSALARIKQRQTALKAVNPNILANVPAVYQLAYDMF
jgi:hypothetical protein